jgi:hypothetical protein
VPYSIIQISFLLLISGLAYKTNKWLQKVDEQANFTAVSSIVSDIITLDEMGTFIHTELTRSRHYERPLAIIAFRIHSSQIPNYSSDLQQENNQSTLIVQCIRSHLQTYHQLARDSKEDLFYLICPELNYALAQKLGRQISGIIADQTSSIVHYASASFPEDGFTFNKIYKETLKRIQITQPVMSATTSHIES